MRTTITLDDDVAAAVAELRRREGIGPSEAVNRFVRRALSARDTPHTYEHRSVSMGARIDVSNVGAVLEFLDEN